MDPLLELFKSVDIPITAAIGVILVMVGEQVISWVLNREHFGPFRNPAFHWNTDRVLPIVTFLLGAGYGWFIGTAPGAKDNVRFALLYGAVVLAVTRIVHKTILGGKPNGTAGSQEQ